MVPEIESREGFCRIIAIAPALGMFTILRVGNRKRGLESKIM